MVRIVVFLSGCVLNRAKQQSGLFCLCFLFICFYFFIFSRRTVSRPCSAGPDPVASAAPEYIHLVILVYIGVFQQAGPERICEFLPAGHVGMEWNVLS
jgi:hypothetical protein